LLNDASEEGGNERVGGPIVVLGVDALDVDLLAHWAREGRLPFLRALLDQGSFARLDSTKDLFGDAPWPSLNAGVSPGHHAFFNHLQLQRGTLDIERIDAHHARALPFWHYLRESGLRVATLDVPKTFPIEELEGVQMSGWGEHYPLLRASASLPTVAPFSVTEPLKGFVHPLELTNPPSRDWERETLKTLISNVDLQRQATAALLAEGSWDFFFSVFSSFHYAGHQFLHHMDSRHWAHEEDAPPVLRAALADVAEHTDAALRDLFDRFPEDATWFIVSVHGFEPNFSANHLMDEVLEGLGYLVPAEDRGASNTVGRVLNATRFVRDLIPQSVRDLINSRLPEGLHDQADSSALAGHWDWTRTRAFMVPSDHFQALLSLNLAGREPHGTVEPGEAAEKLMVELRARLMELKNADTGAPAVDSVVRTADVYQGPNRDELPDLVVRWAKDRPIRGLTHPDLGAIGGDEYPLRKTQHAPDGFLIAGGPGIAEGKTIEGGRTIDFAPTVLRLLGRPIPTELEGRVLEDLLSA